jgi:hypothetical protein
VKPLDAPPLNTELVEHDDGQFQVKWACPTCRAFGITGARGSEERAWSASIIEEANHGEGRCDR